MSTQATLSKIEETLTFYSAGLGEELTVPNEAAPTLPGPEHAVWRDETHEWSPELVQRLTEVFNAAFGRLCTFHLHVSRLGEVFKVLPVDQRRLRRARRAELRRVHRDYMRKRRAERSHVIAFDEIRAEVLAAFRDATQEAP